MATLGIDKRNETHCWRKSPPKVAKPRWGFSCAGGGKQRGEHHRPRSLYSAFSVQGDLSRTFETRLTPSLRCSIGNRRSAAGRPEGLEYVGAMLSPPLNNRRPLKTSPLRRTSLPGIIAGRVFSCAEEGGSSPRAGSWDASTARPHAAKRSEPIAGVVSGCIPRRTILGRVAQRKSGTLIRSKSQVRLLPGPLQLTTRGGGWLKETDMVSLLVCSGVR